MQKWKEEVLEGNLGMDGFRKARNDRGMIAREASERARNRN